MRLGPRTQDQLRRLAGTWKQGEHVMISGATGSGKTTLARHLDEIRLQRGGSVVVFVNKLLPDKTIKDDYKGFTRWDTWKKHPGPHENKVLLWPRTDKAKTISGKRAIQFDVFNDALNGIMNTGHWTVHVDEGFYFCSRNFLNFTDEIAMLHAMGRSGHITMLTLMQRPSDLPLLIYGSASHAFVGRVREKADADRLAKLGGNTSVRELTARIDAQGRHDFLWIPVAPDWQPETVNLRQ